MIGLAGGNNIKKHYVRKGVFTLLTLGVACLLGASVIPADWHSSSFGGSVTVEETPVVITWHSSSFGGSVTVEETPVVITWHSSSFGGSVTVEETISFDIDISPDTWAAGSPNCGDNVTSDYTFYQNGSSTVDVSIGFNDTNYTYVNWTTYTIDGHDQYTANFSTDSWNTETNIEPKTGDTPVTTLYTELAGSSDFSFSLRLWMPKSVSVTGLREDFDVHLNATISP